MMRRMTGKPRRGLTVVAVLVCLLVITVLLIVDSVHALLQLIHRSPNAGDLARYVIGRCLPVSCALALDCNP